MSSQYWQETLVTAQVDGPAITAAAATSCIPPSAKITLRNNFFDVIGKKIRVRVQGRISNVVTTPGTARFDIRLGGTVVFDTGALPLNVVAKTNVPFDLEIDLTCRSIGASTSSTLFGLGKFTSEANVGVAVPGTNNTGSQTLMVPVGAPAVGSGFDSTTALSVDMFFTQTVATGSLTVHQYEVSVLN